MAPSARTMSAALTGWAVGAGVVAAGVSGGCVLNYAAAVGAVVDAAAVGGKVTGVAAAAEVDAGTVGLAGDGDASAAIFADSSQAASSAVAPPPMAMAAAPIDRSGVSMARSSVIIRRGQVAQAPVSRSRT